MKKPLVSGFTFIKNGLSLEYPIKESIESIEPLCDEIIINVGFDNKELNNDDGTYEYLKNYFNHKKFVFLKSYWDPELTSQGLVLSDQTNIALKACTGKYCLYIQGDEVLHENDYPKIHNGILQLEKKSWINGLLFNYIHFYGNTNIIKQTRTTYRNEIRLIRNFQNIKSWKDAQGFKHKDNTKIRVALANACIYHYGWARKENIMSKKIQSFNKLYHGKDHASKSFNYERIWGLKPFNKQHPKIMSSWIKKNKNDLDIMSLPLRKEWEIIPLAISDFIEKISSYRIGEYKNYKLIK